MTTNNHPANGPVSLDRLHQIREILSKAAAQSDGGNLGYAMADAVKVINGVIASFVFEPVAWTSQRSLDVRDKITAFTCKESAESYGNKSSWENIVPLYIAPPLSVVPDEMKEFLRLVECMLVDYRENNFGHASEWIRHISSASDSFENEYFLSPWLWARKPCCAAMLQAGNSPATPDGWKVEAERLAEIHGCSFVVFRHGEEPQCADSTKVIISFTDEGLGHHSEAGGEVIYSRHSVEGV